MEKRDLYDINKLKTGKTIYKNEPIPENNYIVVVIVFIQNSDGKFLIQKRSEIKNGLFAATGGHLASGEDSFQAIIREVKEEIGLDMNLQDLKIYNSGRSDSEKFFWDNFYIKMDIPDIEKLPLQKEEVDFICWLSADEIKSLMNENRFFKNHYKAFEKLLDWLKEKKDK